MKRILFLAGTLLTHFVFGQQTFSSVTIQNYSPILLLKRSTDSGGYIQGVQTQLLDGTNNWFFGNLDSERWMISKGNYQNPKFIISSNGNVGIGITGFPEYKLEVDNGFITSKISDYTVSPTNKVGFLINELGADIFDISYARDGLGTLKMKTFVNNPITFGTNNTERMRINAVGDIGIGTDSPLYKLDVVGDAQFRDFISGGSNSWIFHTPDDGRKTLHIAYGSPSAWEWGKAFVISGDTGNAALNGKFEAKEVKVTLTPTADFVFEEDYNLPKLEEVEKHIKEKKHLPEIASAKVMEKEGVNVGEFQIKLLQKIEELTLYSIEQNKQIKKLQEENKALQSQSEKIERLEKQLEKLLSNQK
ncbi:hypothetical protein MUU74_10095 [Chryseobacterium daecheongense]|uniref:hypothetical protein n=1 Tax=Chryseobacterium daecheongense TaxID=192389 RepID=UPI001FD68F29|nr:hypothetical protein [Chryseobacterium daecheongense]UOU96845.1 hypothetical protein MUU74_10095 [Chryseobacterium daecheongense]